MARRLSRFNVTPAEDGFQIEIEDDDGQVLELTATRDQVEVIADALDELLEESDADGGDVEDDRPED